MISSVGESRIPFALIAILLGCGGAVERSPMVPDPDDIVAPPRAPPAAEPEPMAVAVADAGPDSSADVERSCAEGLVGAALPEADRAAFQRVCVGHAPAADRGCTQPLIPDGPTIACDVEHSHDVACVRLLFVADFTGDISALVREKKLDPKDIGCVASRVMRATARAHASAEMTALLARRDAIESWIKSHCHPGAKTLTSEEPRLHVELGELVYERDVIALSEAPFLCPRNTPKETSQYALGSLGHSELRMKIRAAAQQSELDKFCRATDNEIDACRRELGSSP